MLISEYAFGVQLPLWVRVIVLITSAMLGYLLHYYTLRQIKQVVLGSTHINIEYYKKSKNVNVDLCNIKVIEIYFYKAQNDWWYIVMYGNNQAQFDSHTVPLKDLVAYCAAHNIATEYKDAFESSQP